MTILYLSVVLVELVLVEDLGDLLELVVVRSERDNARSFLGDVARRA